MRLIAALLLLTSLTACTNPQFGATLGFGPDGFSLSPSLSGSIGDARVSVSG
jgi:hypothetical protein